MAFWEFLIQKEGDRSWLPLESPDVEVLEGRYRVVARSSRVNSAVEICVSHIDLEARPPKQRLQKRLSQTNPDGLVVVIPFTRFHPGVWELRCTGDLMSDMIGEGWRYAVRLQVLCHDSDQLGDWDVDDPESSAPEAAEAAVEPAATELEPSSDQADQADQVEELEELEELEEAIPTPSRQANATEPDPFPAVELMLAQTLHVATWGHMLQIRGQIEPLAADASGALSTMPVACLHLTLRNPQTADVVATVQQPLESGSLPYPFAVEIKVPDTEPTRLLLGEVVLTAGVGAGLDQALAAAAFTITTDLNHLLEAIANNFSSNLYPPVEFVDQSVESSLDLSLLNLVNSSRASQVTHLPLSRANVDDQPAIVADGVQLQAGSGWVEVPVPAAPVPGNSAPLALPDPLADEPLEWDAAELEMSVGWPAQSAYRPSPLALPAANVPKAQDQDQDFQSLNLQNRFLSRLSDLALDGELSESLQADAPPFGLDNTLAAQEFVLHDEQPLPPVRTSIAAQPAKKAPEPEPAILSEDEPVPTPTLTLPAAELIAGRQIDVLVTLPDLQSRLYVKLWVRDRQTHTTLDGPRWVMHFNPNGRGGQQAQTVMTIPWGCLDAQFEAIAIEMATQRESHKVTIPRAVIPPDLPTISIDDLEL